MRAGLRLHETRVETDVPFHHVDALRIVWHGHYPKYFELASTALLQKLGLDSGEIGGTRFKMVVIDSAVRHSFPMRYADRVEICAWISEYARRVTVRYEIRNLTHDKRTARGHTTLATLDDEGRLRLETPPEIAARIAGDSR
ncbi:MAG: acyl-CoA thioesterase [Myxococcota bacterium]